MKTRSLPLSILDGHPKGLRQFPHTLLEKEESITEWHGYIFHELARIQVYMCERDIVLRDCVIRFDSSRGLPSPWLNSCTPHPFPKSGCKEGGLLIFLPHSLFNLRQALDVDSSVKEVCLCQRNLAGMNFMS